MSFALYTRAVIARRIVLIALAAVACSGDQSRNASGRPDGSGDGDVGASGDGSRGGAVDGGGASVGGGKASGGGGTLVVIASLPGAGAAAMTSPGRNACGAPTRAPVEVFIRDRTQTVTGLAHAVVEVEGIERAPAAAGPAVEVSIRDCRVRPVMARAGKVGGALALINDDERRHDVLVEHLGDGSGRPEPIARVPLALVGQRVELALPRAGIVRISAAADERDHAYVFVPSHPFVAVTDSSGAARIEGIPPGRYQVKVWHPPLERGGKPLVARAQVAIEAGKSVEQIIALDAP